MTIFHKAMHLLAEAPTMADMFYISGAAATRSLDDGWIRCAEQTEEGCLARHAACALVEWTESARLARLRLLYSRREPGK